MKKGFIFFACITILLVIFASCGVSVDGDKTSADSEKVIVTKEAKSPFEDQIKIAFLPYVIGDSVASAWGTGAERELSVFDNITFQIFDGEASAETQVRIMSDLVNQEYDAIILQAVDSAALATSVKEAELAGIPVVTLNLDADTPHAGLIAMVDSEAGALVAKEIAKSLNGNGNVVIIQASPGATRGELLESGFRNELSKHPGITILDAQTAEWLTEKANIVMNDFMTKYDKIDGVFAHNDAMAEGASQAAEASGRLNEMVIWGADGESKALEYIEKGKMTGTIYTNCFDQGAMAARLCIYLIGSEIDTTSFTSTPIVKMAPIVATKDTVHLIGEDIRW